MQKGGYAYAKRWVYNMFNGTRTSRFRGFAPSKIKTQKKHQREKLGLKNTDPKLFSHGEKGSTTCTKYQNT